ncbi:tyrosine-type recombinase/integrase [Nocardia sp. NPDC050175]|uniref:tyrosine-type recombinase/integrase n=1 Tax=Nocardia sp. NPDC050175 TaxID=3364317 RepID=UPI0037B81BE3
MSADRWTLAESRDVHSLVVVQVGSVVVTTDPLEPARLIDVDGRVDEHVRQFVRHLVACDYSPHSCRSYLLSLLRWFRFLAAVQVKWNHAARQDVRDFVLWLRIAKNPQRRHRRRDGSVAGSVNPVTGKATLPEGYAASTINHSLSAVKMFYDYHLLTGFGPVVNPVPLQRGNGRDRPGSHRSPIEAPLPNGRAPYRQRARTKSPRALPDAVFDDFFAALPSNRDRAIVSIAVGSGPRASELLGMGLADLDIGRQLVAFEGKGHRELEWVPAPPDSFLWLAAYLAETEHLRPVGDTRLWWTLRRPTRPLTYWALRQVLNRANERLGANVTFHDLRHTYAMRLMDDPNLLITDVQRLMRHRSLASTQIYARARIDDLVRKMREHYARPAPADPSPDPSYDPAAMSVLFPGLT